MDWKKKQKVAGGVAAVDDPEEEERRKAGPHVENGPSLMVAAPVLRRLGPSWDAPPPSQNAPAPSSDGRPFSCERYRVGAVCRWRLLAWGSSLQEADAVKPAGQDGELRRPSQLSTRWRTRSRRGAR